jgi:glycosyltransferase involved in cell wall biosynthesis
LNEAPLNYVIVTPARNEEAFIQKTIESVVKQTVLPLKWVIVNDGSTDSTSSIVRSYLAKNPWIDLVDLPVRKERDFAAKVHAFNEGLRQMQDCDFALIANLDADISFGPDHFEFLISKFEGNPRLGVIGTAYTQENGWDSTQDSFEGETSVHGACQLFRLQCFLDIGGYCANRAGGIDWIAVTTARMKGWETRNYRERYFHHYRTMGTAKRGPLGAMYDYGRKDYFLGGSPVWELLRVLFRMTKKPVVFGGLALLAGYCVAAVGGIDRPVSPELIRFHRDEQMKKLQMILRSLFRSGKLQTYLPPVSKEPSEPIP